MKSKHRQRGFTLLELLVVIAIIGLLAAFVGPRYIAQVGKSQRGVAQAQMDGFAKALDQYRVDIGYYPSTEQGLVALFAPPANEPLWRGPYVKKQLSPDPWGSAYVYGFPSTDPKRDFDLLSYGRDGKAGGNGEDADLSNWE